MRKKEAIRLKKEKTKERERITVIKKQDTIFYSNKW